MKYAIYIIQIALISACHNFPYISSPGAETNKKTYWYLNSEGKEKEVIFEDTSNSISINVSPKSLTLDSTTHTFSLVFDIFLEIENKTKDELKNISITINPIMIQGLKDKKRQPISGSIREGNLINSDVLPKTIKKNKLTVIFYIDNSIIRNYIKNKLVIDFEAISIGNRSVAHKAAVFYNQR
jgi:hypothetical protein